MNKKIIDKSGIICTGTGTKSIGNDLLSKDGTIIIDSHAEVICRRSFVKWTYDQINDHIEGKETILFEKHDKCYFEIKKNLKLHMYISQTPCKCCGQ